MNIDDNSDIQTKSIEEGEEIIPCKTIIILMLAFGPLAYTGFIRLLGENKFKLPIMANIFV